MTTRASRMAIAVAIAATAGSMAASPSFAQESKIDAADTAWMIVATGFVLMMTLPGLGLFYAGMVRKKNVLATLAQSLAAAGICSLLWFAVAYSLAFGGDGAVIGSFDRVFLNGIGMDTTHPAAANIPG